MPTISASVNCHFEGDLLLNAMSTRIGLNIGQLVKMEGGPLALEISANHRRVGLLSPLHSKLQDYSFIVPPGTWFEGDNSLNLSLVDDRGALDQRSGLANTILVRWILVDFVAAASESGAVH